MSDADDKVSKVTLVKLGECLHCDVIEIINLHAKKGMEVPTAIAMLVDCLALTMVTNGTAGKEEGNLVAVQEHLAERVRAHMDTSAVDLASMHVVGHA